MFNKPVKKRLEAQQLQVEVANARYEAERLGAGRQLLSVDNSIRLYAEGADYYREQLSTINPEIERISELNYQAGEISYLELLNTLKLLASNRRTGPGAGAQPVRCALSISFKSIKSFFKMKIINNSILSILSITALLLLFSCGGGHTEGDGHNHGDEAEAGAHAGEGEHQEGEIHLTPEQIKTMNIQFGGVSQIKINDFVSATGTLGLPPNALTSVSAKASGFIKDSKKYVEGMYVKKGVVMAYLENPEFIQHQREYLETGAESTYLRQELERQQKLVEASAGVEKNLQKLQSEVGVKTATLKGIGKQLAYLGINVSALSPDNIVERIAIVAPMTGYITSIKMHNGMYVTPELELMEIVNEDHLHLELDVFEKGHRSGEGRAANQLHRPGLGQYGVRGRSEYHWQGV